LIHTVKLLIELFDHLSADLLPGVTIQHILDEPLLERVRQRGALAEEDADRIKAHACEAEAIGASAVLVTCSTMSCCVDAVRPQVHIPVFKIDEAMTAEAVKIASRIGVVATNVTTLQPTRQLLVTQAAGKPLEIEMLLVEHALEALLRGDGATHDHLVKEAVQVLSANVDTIVLAQASMARVLAVIPASERAIPILASPQLALAQVKEYLTTRKEGHS